VNLNLVERLTDGIFSKALQVRRMVQRATSDLRPVGQELAPATPVPGQETCSCPTEIERTPRPATGCWQARGGESARCFDAETRPRRTSIG